MTISSGSRSLLLLGGVVLALKLGYLLQYAGLPFLNEPLFDSVLYAQQARFILLGRLDGPPLRHLSPLYGFFLAFLGGGHRPVLPVLVQLLLGGVNLGLLYRLGERLFSPRAGLCAAALYLGYGVTLFHESKLLPETLALTLSIGALSLYLSPEFSAGRRNVALGCGAVLGLLLLTREHLLLSIGLFPLLALWPRPATSPPLAASAALPAPADGPLRSRRALLCLLGLALVVLAQGTFAVSTGQPFRALNLPALRGARGGSELGALDGEHDIIPRTAVIDLPAALAHNVGVARTLADAATRLLYTFADSEAPSHQYSYYGERDDLSVYEVLPVSFGMILLLGVVGAGFLWRERGASALMPYLPLVLGTAAMALLSPPRSWYRVEMIVPLLLLSGRCLDGLLTGLLDAPLRRPRLLFAAAVWLGCLALMARTELYELRNPATYQLIVAAAAVRAGLFRDALDRVARARALSPGDPAIEAIVRNIVGIRQTTLRRQ